MAEQPLYEPRKLYANQFEHQFHENAALYFDSLARQAKTDTGANKLHVKAYDAAMVEVEEAKKRLDSSKTARGFMIAGFVIAFAAAVITFIIGIMNASSMWWMFLIAAACLGLGIAGAVSLKTNFNKKVKAAEEVLAQKQKKAQEALDVCKADMATLNALFDDTMPQEVLEKTTPIIDLDGQFRPDRLCYLMSRFGMEEENDPNVSVEGVISGQIQGNPFILEKVFTHDFHDKVWEGSLTYTYTTTSVDSKGHTVVHTHTDTLYAQIERPAPFYGHETRLIFGSEVAPDLTFSRGPSGMSGASEKDAKKFVAKRVKELDKQEEAAIKAGKSFTKLGNDEFEAYFGADDRNNEVQYRLMFTALAQRNILDLLKNPAPYGDDFYMVKDKMLTSVASGHSQNFDYHPDVSYFYDYDFEAARKRFIAYCDEFIRGIFFDLAPILSIPLYQLHKPREYIYNRDYPCNTTSFEHEIMANRMSQDDFRPEGADPSLPLILKQMTAKAIEGGDEVRIHAMSYQTFPEVEYVTKMGRDGMPHAVPVHWIRYEEVGSENNIAVFDSAKKRPDFIHASLEPLRKYLKDNFHFERGLVSYYLGAKKGLDRSEATEVSSVFKNASN